MYHFIRRIHLFAGLVLLVFVLMYFLTGYVIIHNKWFGDNKPKITTRTETLNYTGNITNDALSLHLQEKFSLPGKRIPPKTRPNGTVQFVFAHPGVMFEALVSEDGKQVTITRRDQAFVATAHSLHALRGYEGGAFYWVWSLVYDLASAAMILFAVSGVYLWYKSVSNRLPGWICLAASCGFTAAMMLYLLYRK